MSATTGPVIEVFADVWCPFAHVGLRTIEEQWARTGRTDVAIWVRAWSLELANGIPLDPMVTEKHADELRAQVAPNLFGTSTSTGSRTRRSMPSHWPTGPIGPTSRLASG